MDPTNQSSGNAPLKPEETANNTSEITPPAQDASSVSAPESNVDAPATESSQAGSTDTTSTEALSSNEAPIAPPVEPDAPSTTDVISAGPVTSPIDSSPTVTPITPQPPKKSRKPIIIAVVVFIVLAIIAGAVVFLMAGKKNTNKATTPTTNNSAKITKKTTTISASNTAQSSAPKAIPGYVTLDKLCYSIQVPKENDAGAENSCLFSARFGAQKLPGINFTYFTKPSEGLDANVASLKESEAKLKNTLFSEENVKIGGIDSKKLIFKGTGYSSETQTVHYFIPTNKYKVSGVPITGFYVISSLYEKPEYKSVIDNIMSSVQWK
ncbi:MAG: hypothetical protein WCF91_03265 [bacterium]